MVMSMGSDLKIVNGEDYGVRSQHSTAEFLRKKLSALQKDDRNLSERIERLKKRMESSQE